MGTVPVIRGATPAAGTGTPERDGEPLDEALAARPGPLVRPSAR